MPKYAEFHALVEGEMKLLKSHAHELRRHRENNLTGKREFVPKKDLFDMVCGHVFHEMEDLCEAVDQVQDYKPRIEGYVPADDEEKAILEMMRQYVSEAEERIPRKFGEVKTWFTVTADVLTKRVLPLYSKNQQLLKSLVLADSAVSVSCLENELHDYARLVSLRTRLDDIFSEMYKDGAFEAYYKAGVSWLEQRHLALAVGSLTKALTYYPTVSQKPGFDLQDKKYGKFLEAAGKLFEISKSFDRHWAETSQKGHKQSTRKMLVELVEKMYAL